MALTKRFIGKTTTQEKVKTVIKQRQRSVHRMVGSGTREAQGRVRRGGLLDEDADCECEVGFEKKALPCASSPRGMKEIGLLSIQQYFGHSSQSVYSAMALALACSVFVVALAVHARGKKGSRRDTRLAAVDNLTSCDVQLFVIQGTWCHFQ